MTSSSASANLIPLNTFNPGSATDNPPAPDDNSSFNDVLQRQGGDSTPTSGGETSKTSAVATSSADDGQADLTTETVPATATAASPKGGGHGGHTKSSTQNNQAAATTTTAGSDLKSLLVRAAVLAPNHATEVPSANPGASSTESDTTTATTKGTDLATMIAQALAQMTNTKPVTITTPSTTTSVSAKDEESADGGKSSGHEASTSGTSDLSTLVTQASILLLSAQPTAPTAPTSGSKNLPVSASGPSIFGVSGKEKKSSASNDRGSFLQSGTREASTASSLPGAFGLASSATSSATGHQQLVTAAGSKKAGGDGIAGIAASGAGTANVEKKQTMNADQNLPGILNGIGTTTLQQTPSDMQIKLSTNTDFDHALTQVLHVASLAPTDSTGAGIAPTRVAIELQTPPGAIVNVYVTRQSDETYRAQLSTNDPAALSWVQDKLSSLKDTSSTITGVEVKWAPAQIETASASAGGESNLGWDRGGQGQAQYQQDERQGRQNPQNDSDNTETVTEFMNNLNSYKEAA